MTVSNELIDSLLANYKKLEDLIGEHGLLKQLTKKLIERVLGAEMVERPGHARNEQVTICLLWPKSVVNSLSKCTSMVVVPGFNETTNQPSLC